jgi:KaiC/GvpD/RAD55 family RecA-like ATPase
MNDYTLGIKELDNATGGIRKGSNILLIGPSMSGRDAILRHIMYYGAAKNENAIITVTTRESATHILDWFTKNKLTLPLSRIGIVDCVTKTDGGIALENEIIKTANSPVDLTGIGVRISQFFEEFFMKKNIPKIQLHVDSLSTILMYSNIETIFKFLHVFTGRIKANGGLGIYVIESGMHEEQTMAILKHLFDGVIEIKSESDRNFLKVVGLSSKPTPFFEYEITGIPGQKPRII